MIDINKIYCGDHLKILKQVDDNVVDLTITSPPYDNLRDYKKYNFDWRLLLKELYRVTKEGCVVVWVVGDAVINGSESGTSFKQALWAKYIGFNIHDTMIYEKNSTTFSAHDNSNRYSQIFEYMFIFSKGKPKTYNLIKDKLNRWGGCRTFGQKTYRQKDGELIKQPSYIVQKIGYRNNIWRINTGYKYSTKDKIAYEHSAIFPEKLVQDHIITWSNENDLILDPMCGSGTTCKIAKITKRNYIGIDIAEEYCTISRKRIKNILPNLF